MTVGGGAGEMGPGGAWRTLAEIKLPTRPGTDRLAAELVCCVARRVGLAQERLDRLETAVAEAALNALEHGNTYSSELPVLIKVFMSDHALTVHVTDYGTSGPISPQPAPDIDAKLAGSQTPHGWGFFLIEKMVDAVRLSADDTHHTVELLLYLENTQA